MNYRLTAFGLDFYVDVALRNFDGRWLAVADLCGDKEIGLGRSSRAALAASLSSLGTQAASLLMTDRQLRRISCRVR